MNIYEKIQLEAYYLHLRFPHNSSQTNWYNAEKNIKNTLNSDNSSDYIVNILQPNYYTTSHLNIQHYDEEKMDNFKNYLYIWGMTDMFNILEDLVIKFENN